MTLAKPIRKRDEAYLRWIRLQASCVSGQTPCEAHHVREDGHGGMGTKPDDSRVVPLTRDEHRDFHEIGKEAFELKHGADLELTIWSLRVKYEMHVKPAVAGRAPRKRAMKIHLDIQHCQECGQNHAIPQSKLSRYGAALRFRCPVKSQLMTVRIGA
jgi:hypothetical protein